MIDIREPVWSNSNPHSEYNSVQVIQNKPAKEKEVVEGSSETSGCYHAQKARRRCSKPSPLLFFCSVNGAYTSEAAYKVRREESPARRVSLRRKANRTTKMQRFVNESDRNITIRHPETPCRKE